MQNWWSHEGIEPITGSISSRQDIPGQVIGCVQLGQASVNSMWDRLWTMNMGLSCISTWSTVGISMWSVMISNKTSVSLSWQKGGYWLGTNDDCLNPSIHFCLVRKWTNKGCYFFSKASLPFEVLGRRSSICVGWKYINLNLTELCPFQVSCGYTSLFEKEFFKVAEFKDLI